MVELCDVFAVELFAFAVMGNHYYAVLYLEPFALKSWSDEEVAELWLRAYLGRLHIELVEWNGKAIHYPNKHAMPAHVQSSLQQLNLQQAHWLKKIELYGKSYCYVVGPIEPIKEKAKQLNLKWMKGNKVQGYYSINTNLFLKLKMIQLKNNQSFSFEKISTTCSSLKPIKMERIINKKHF